MTSLHLPLAEGVTRTVFEWGRIQSNSDWILPVGACLAIALFVRAMARRDAVELRPGLGWLLTGLRTAVFLGLLILYLHPQWRSEREVTRNSRVLVLVDTSSSMGLTDSDSGMVSRGRQIADALADSDLLDSLRRVHDVVVLGFDEDVRRIASFDKWPVDGPDDPAPDPDAAAKPSLEIDWADVLAPTGTETRLGEALRQLVYEERGDPIAGIVLLSDGRQNAGKSVQGVAQAAADANIPIFPVGLGSDREPTNVRVYKLEAPPRAYPDDPYQVTALIQAQGPDDETGEAMAGRSVQVQLFLRDADDSSAAPGTGTLVDSRTVLLAAGGETVPVRFELAADQIGRQTVGVRVEPPRDDHNRTDDYREVDVEVVDRKDRVLLFAGGPTREYRFLRSQLYRDASMTVDVLLQTAAPGVSQDADALLDGFPLTPEEMFAYDCMVAIDPDWQALSADQIELLERWVAEQGGGMIAVAGSVYAGEAVTGWVQDPAMEKILALYPVTFYRRASVLESSVRSGKDPWAIEFTREGLDADHLRLDDDATASLEAWTAFSGVYSYCPIREPKAAATVLARFSDPRAVQGDGQPIYLAEQFYGVGRVFYLGSGEMWRLRQADEAYFERFYTNLIRHVSQGRMLRQSSHGVLMVGQDRYALGKTVEIRAQLADAQLNPLEVAQVGLDVFEPDGGVQTVLLRPDLSRAGMYTGQHTVLQEGTYRFELPVPESSAERIVRRIQVSLPDLERQNPTRNDALLTLLTGTPNGSNGRYYDSLAAAIEPGSAHPLVEQLKDRTKTVILTAAPDPDLEERWLRWLMLVLCGLLSAEWLIRRLWKLA